MKPIQCPQCNKLTIYSSDNKSRPFCSERCKLIDLGEWAEENYKIPDEKNKFDTEPEEESEQSSLKNYFH